MRISPKIPARACATIIDYTVFIIFFAWYLYAFGEPNNEGGYSTSGYKALGIELVWVIYFPFLEALSGRTLGKWIMGLKVIHMSGGSLNFWRAFKRRILDPIDILSFGGLVAYITVKNTPNHQRLGDLIAKTVVIGGDEWGCEFCESSLTLSHEEIQKKEFVCPECKKINTVELFLKK